MALTSASDSSHGWRAPQSGTLKYPPAWEKIASDFFDTAPAFPSAKSGVFADCAGA
jgi:hypothetical protein